MLWLSAIRFSKRLVFITALALAACQPLVASPAPTPQTLHVQLTPALSDLRQRLHDCAVANPAWGLLIDELPASSLSEAKSDLAFRLGYPQGFPGYAAIAGWETLVVIVHPANPIDRLDTDTFRALLTGDLTEWKEAPGISTGFNHEVTLWTYSTGDDTRQALLAAVLEGDMGVSKSAYLAPSPEEMLQAIAGDPGAIGYLPARWLNDRVRVVELDEPLESALRIPVIALSQKEPQGAARELLGCLQKG